MQEIIILNAVESGNIAGIYHCPESYDLIVAFKNNSAYRYKSVPAGIYNAFSISPSKGAYLAKHIKPNFKVEKLDLAKFKLEFPLKPDDQLRSEDQIGE